MSDQGLATASPRGPGRPAKARPTRTPLGQRNRLTVPEGMIPKGMVGRWINDKDGRVKQALEAGYEHIASDEKTGDPRVADPSQMGSKVSKSVGGGTTAYLMAIPEDFYKEDQKAKQDRVDASERAMKAPPKGAKLAPDATGTAYGEGLTND